MNHCTKKEIIVLQRPLHSFFSCNLLWKFHLIGTLESITSPHKHKALTLRHISVPLIIPCIKSGVETASVPRTDWHSVCVAPPANSMLSKRVQLTSSMVDNTQSGACPCKGHEHWTWCSTATSDVRGLCSCCLLLSTVGWINNSVSPSWKNIL